MDETLKWYLITLVVLCVCYQMNNLFGRLARLFTIGAVLLILFSGYIDSWTEKLLMVSIFGLPMYISWFIKFYVNRQR